MSPGPTPGFPENPVVMLAVTGGRLTGLQADPGGGHLPAATPSTPSPAAGAPFCLWIPPGCSSPTFSRPTTGWGVGEYLRPAVDLDKHPASVRVVGAPLADAAWPGAPEGPQSHCAQLGAQELFHPKAEGGEGDRAHARVPRPLSGARVPWRGGSSSDLAVPAARCPLSVTPADRGAPHLPPRRGRS